MQAEPVHGQTFRLASKHTMNANASLRQLMHVVPCGHFKLWPQQKSTHQSNVGRRFKVLWPRRLPAFGTARERANTATNAQRSLRCAAEHKTGSIANAVSSTSTDFPESLEQLLEKARALACWKRVHPFNCGWVGRTGVDAGVRVGCVITPMRPSVGAKRQPHVRPPPAGPTK